MLAPSIAAQSSDLENSLPRRAANIDFASDLTLLKASADRGLSWLAAQQQDNGSWPGHVGHKQSHSYRVIIWSDSQGRKGDGHLGVTSLAGLAFLAGGHLPDRGKYGEVVRSTIDYILAHMKDNGFVTDGGSRMYSHAFATLFLAQIYGMGREKRTNLGLERAVHWIIDSQNRQGGWRYNPFAEDADLSVTVCQLQALRSARNIGVNVPRGTIDRAVDYVARSHAKSGSEKGRFYYKVEGRGAWRKTRQYSINAAGLTSLFSAGIHDPEIYEPVLDFLDEEYHDLVADFRNHFYYWYGNYYACQAYFQAGGLAFRNYHRRICSDLMDDQEDDGRWRNDVGPGDALSTAVASMILQIPLQYLPIFQR